MKLRKDVMCQSYEWREAYSSETQYLFTNLAFTNTRIPFTGVNKRNVQLHQLYINSTQGTTGGVTVSKLD